MLMAMMLVAGFVATGRLTTEFLPDFEIDRITISVAWPGASAEDVDDAIVQLIEPEVRFVDGVTDVRSVSREGGAAIRLNFAPGTDMQAALSKVEAAVSQIGSLPESSERPEITRAERYEVLARLAVSGPYSEKALNAYANQIRDDLLARGVDRVTISGERDEEIWVEVSPETLLRLDLSIEDIAQRIDEVLVDTPLGVASGPSEQQLRSLGPLKEAEAVSGIEVIALPNGQKIYLGDVADITDAFDPDQPILRLRGTQAVDLVVQRRVGSDALEAASVLENYLNGSASRFPRDLKIEPHLVAVELITSRINLLVRNAIGGLLLVLLILFLFLNGPVAFWVSMGIPVSIMATLGIMALTGQSVNMISLFGILMVLGIIVDDAIIVGEHVERRYQQGELPLEAAVGGAERMLWPVLGASLTTIAAFIPLLTIGDAIGQIIAAIPMVVIAVIIASLIECFLILPGHLHHSLARHRDIFPKFRAAFDGRFDRFRDRLFRRSVAFALRFRYATISLAVGALVVTLGLVAGGRLVFTFFPSPEADVVFANVEFSVGTPRSITAAMVDELEDALERAEAELQGGGPNFVRLPLATVGASSGPSGSGRGDHIGSVTVELMPSDERTVRTEEFIEAWRNQVRLVPGITSLTILPVQFGPPGRALQIDLLGDDSSNLKAAAEELKRLLARYPSITDIEDDLPYGKPELILEITPQGLSMGFTSGFVARQIRNSFEGAIATRFARDGDEIAVRVQFSEDDTGASTLETLYLRSRDGIEVPLSEIVSFREHVGFASIVRENGDRLVSVTGEFANENTSLRDVLRSLEAGGLRDIAARYGLAYSFSGKAEEEADALSDIEIGAIAALALIYLILAWTFESYLRPLVVMSIVPFAVIGAVLGHLLLGYNLTIFSVVALVGLMGIVVNDSIILVSTVDERIGRGQEIFTAIVDGACDRLRAVILTSVTTIGGLTPLLFETSLQARFLTPMAVTLVFGLAATTLLVLFVVPSIIGIQADFSAWFDRFRGRHVSDTGV